MDFFIYRHEKFHIHEIVYQITIFVQCIRLQLLEFWNADVS